MNSTFTVFIGLMIVAMFSLGVATLFSWNLSVVYLVSLIIWFISIKVYYKSTEIIKSQQEIQK
ncbi:MULTISPECIES: hypothetical protein [Staphylococcus]|uniref:hypothetical protein n=1 Tax=Staphylococcus TaxID=1279 RepID=UPI000734B45F|nr:MULTISPECIES: hypothetical protein [Staphylococcus]KTW22468.1 hypothetical protein NS341_07350 [Staphylococcus xylosus]